MADGQPVEESTSSVVEDTVQEEDLDVSAARVEGVRYRVSVVIFLIAILLVVLYAVIPSWDRFQAVRDQLATQDKSLKEFDAKKQTYEKNLAFIALIQKSESDIADCVNNRVNCNSLDSGIKENFAFARSFLLLSDLNDPKMEINEKTLLRNINEYLLAKSSASVENISFGKSELVEGNLYSVPITIRAEFPSKDNLFAFIDRVDKQIPVNESVRVLYKLDEVSYDIMHYNESQSVDLSLHAFYYKQ